MAHAEAAEEGRIVDEGGLGFRTAGNSNVFRPSSPYGWDPHKVVFSYYYVYNVESNNR